jgi:hypothetical protein
MYLNDIDEQRYNKKFHFDEIEKFICFLEKNQDKDQSTAIAFTGDITVSDIKDLIYVFTCRKELICPKDIGIYFVSNDFNDEHATHLAYLLQHIACPPNIVIQIVSECFTDKGVVSIAKALQSKNYLSQPFLDLSFENKNNEAQAAFAEAIKDANFPKQSSIYLRYDGRINKGEGVLAESLKNTDINLKSFIFYHRVTLPIVQDFSSMLARGEFHNNTTFYFTDCGINDQGVELISQAWLSENCPSTLSFYFDNNRLTDYIAIAICHALQQNGCPKLSLSLAHNNISMLGAVYIEYALRKNCQLIAIDLKRNPINDAGIQSLVNGLKINTCLTDFAIDGKSESQDLLIKSYCLRNKLIAQYPEFTYFIETLCAEHDLDAPSTTNVSTKTLPTLTQLAGSFLFFNHRKDLQFFTLTEELNSIFSRYEELEKTLLPIKKRNYKASN